MNTAITTTLISVLGAGLFGMFFVLMRNLFMMLKNLNDTMANGFAAVDVRFGRLEDRFGRLENRVDNLTGEVHALEIRLFDKFIAELRRLETKFTGELKAHDQRLARIEEKLERDPPAEAA